MATPPPSLKPRPSEEKKPVAPVAQKKYMELPDAVKRGEQTITDFNKLIKDANRPVAPVVGEAETEDDESKKVRPGRVAGRGDRHEKRVKRAEERKGRSNEDVKNLLDDDDGPVRVKLKKKKLHHQRPTEQRKERVVLATPITVRAFCEATGLPKGDVLFRLKDLGQMATVNSTIDPDTAELIIADRGLDVEIRRQLDVETRVLAEQEKPDLPEELVLRAPIVTIMGHVDHGKTTLLDQIRKSDVAATEAGGITQVLRAWRVDHGGRPITFLDTPGHEAFTKMRARGANVTDIAVIVVAADDGVMPQTEEAISHAKAAGVSLIVAVNKVDLPNANVRKTEQQLYSLGLVPDTMGGDVPFVHTSGAKGTGVKELLDTISLVAELKELKANPYKAARGTVLEAMLSEGEGVLATLLVRDGMLRLGDVIFCGAAHGRVRAMYNDLGLPIEEAGPSVPVRITGLDVVPNADDSFQVITDLSLAREIAENRRIKQAEATMITRAPVRLETLTEAKIAELKVILKADFRGSIEAISKEMQKLQHEEVRVRVLHTGIGGITESDVNLALASPEDTIIVGFNVVPDENAHALAENRGIQIREYDIIYKLTEDIRAALEGKLKPREEIVHLGRAVVRETFKISRTGTIAGCYVTQGVIERAAKVRVIREGVVIYPPSDRTVGLDSLKRFKEDTREVREGFECGLKITGYDDIKVGDVIEAYRIEQVQRTLE
jgi:translation initiation factor IF-2